jgi:hypothetical protein
MYEKQKNFCCPHLERAANIREENLRGSRRLTNPYKGVIHTSSETTNQMVMRNKKMVGDQKTNIPLGEGRNIPCQY